MKTCVCPAQLLPHDPIVGVCVIPAMDRELPEGCVRPWDPGRCYVWGGACRACAVGNEDDPRVQQEDPVLEHYRDLGGEG